MTIQTIDQIMKERGYSHVADSGSGDSRYYLKMIDAEGKEFAVHLAVNLNTFRAFISFTQFTNLLTLVSTEFIVNDNRDFELRENGIIVYASKCIDVDVKDVLDKWKNSSTQEVKAPKKTIEERKKEFWLKVRDIAKPKGYSKEMAKAFYDYWSEKNESGRKMRFELQDVFDISRRLKTWDMNDKNRIASKKNFVEQKIEKQNEDKKAVSVNKKREELF